MAYSSEECYDMSGARKSLMLCAASAEEGGDSDMRIMRHFFRQFGFEGYGENIIKQATAKVMRDHIQRFQEKITRDWQKISCIMVSVSCHGNLVELMADDCKLIKVNEIIEPFSDNNCPRLKGIPKIFILDACRGHPKRVQGQISDSGVFRCAPPRKPTVEDEEIRQLRVNHAPPVINDMFTVYPTMSGYTALCSPNGAYLHECIGKVFLDEWSYNRGNHLDDLFLKVNRKLQERNTYNAPAISALVVESTFQKLLFLD